MQYAVPQFTDVEDKLIGPLTLKQFLILLASGGLGLFFYSLLGLSLAFFLFALPPIVLGLGMAFGTFNGRPLFGFVPAFISFFSRPQVRIFKRQEPDMVIKKLEKPQIEQTVADKNLNGEAESRLKKLAYLLDQKKHEEEELINK
jgi:hypothetical protein